MPIGPITCNKLAALRCKDCMHPHFKVLKWMGRCLCSVAAGGALLQFVVHELH